MSHDSTGICQRSSAFTETGLFWLNKYSCSTLTNGLYMTSGN